MNLLHARLTRVYQDILDNDIVHSDGDYHSYYYCTRCGGESPCDDRKKKFWAEPIHVKHAPDCLLLVARLWIDVEQFYNWDCEEKAE